MDDIMTQSLPHPSNLLRVPIQALAKIPMRRSVSNFQRYTYADSSEDGDEADDHEPACQTEDSSYARRVRQSDHAKRLYESYFDTDFIAREMFNPHPLPLEVPPNRLWYSWGADRCRWLDVDDFRDFCELADVDPDSGICWSPYLLQKRGIQSLGTRYSFRSRSKNLGFECSSNPFEIEGDGFRFGITGERQNVKTLLHWFRLNVVWDRMSIGERFYI